MNTETNTEMEHLPNNTLKLKLEYNNWNKTETDTEMGHQPHDNWNGTEINTETHTEMGHQQNDTQKLKLKTNQMKTGTNMNAKMWHWLKEKNTEMNIEMRYQLKETETNTDMGHQPNNTMKLKLEYDNWN